MPQSTLSLGEKQTNQIVDHFFRHEFGKVIAHLTKVFGTSNIEIIEDAVQDTLYKAMQVWPYNRPPDNPSAWIMRASKNRVIDTLRLSVNKSKSDLWEETFDEDPNRFSQAETNVILDHELKDDQLNMIFACCHPILSTESQIILTLKLLCGFSKTEIAKALLKKEDAVAKAFTRAKSKMKESEVELHSPIEADIQERLDTVLRVLYLLFNEGYMAAAGDDLIRKDVCIEAMRLTQLLTENKLCNLPRVNALLALMCFQASRLDARIDEGGLLVPLEKQNRNLWNNELISYGNLHLARASHGVQFTEYHIQASIAATHSNAEDYESTNWEQILQLYNILLANVSSPVIELNRLVAYSKVNGPDEALKALNALEKEKSLHNYHLMYAIKGQLMVETGNKEEAAKWFQKAHEITANTAEKRFLKSRLESLLD